MSKNYLNKKTVSKNIVSGNGAEVKGFANEISTDGRNVSSKIITTEKASGFVGNNNGDDDIVILGYTLNNAVLENDVEIIKLFNSKKNKNVAVNLTKKLNESGYRFISSLPTTFDELKNNLKHALTIPQTRLLFKLIEDLVVKYN